MPRFHVIEHRDDLVQVAYVGFNSLNQPLLRQFGIFLLSTGIKHI